MRFGQVGKPLEAFVYVLKEGMHCSTSKVSQCRTLPHYHVSSLSTLGILPGANMPRHCGKILRNGASGLRLEKYIRTWLRIFYPTMTLGGLIFLICLHMLLKQYCIRPLHIVLTPSTRSTVFCSKKKIADSSGFRMQWRQVTHKTCTNKAREKRFWKPRVFH